MNRFSSLLPFSSGESPSVVQAAARSAFPETIRRSKFALRRPAAPFPPNTTVVVLGVATFSTAEMKLLDDIEAALTSDNGDAPIVAVFDTVDCREMSDFESFIPGLDSAYQTPVIGIAVNGKITERASGLLDVERLLREFHVLSPGDRTASSKIG